MGKWSIYMQSSIMNSFIKLVRSGEIASGTVQAFKTATGKNIKFKYDLCSDGTEIITKAVVNRRYPNCQFQGLFKLLPDNTLKRLQVSEVSDVGRIIHSPFKSVHSSNGNLVYEGPITEMFYRVDGNYVHAATKGFGYSPNNVQQIELFGKGSMRAPEEIKRATEEIRTTSCLNIFRPHKGLI